MKTTYIDHMGTDLSVVNAARVSFGKTSEWENGGYIGDDIWPNLTAGEKDLNGGTLSKADQGLIDFLARGCTSGDWEGIKDELEQWAIYGDEQDVEYLLNHVKSMPSHWTPFGHCQISLHMKVPIFVARQIHKHQVGFVVNEISRRYVTDEPDFFMPEVWREAADNVKQGSSDEAIQDNDWHRANACKAMNDAVDTYISMIDAGICAEQARMVLPQSMYTEFHMTGSLYGWAQFFIQRSDSHAQKEIQLVATQVAEIIKPLYPHSWKALTR